MCRFKGVLTYAFHQRDNEPVLVNRSTHLLDLG